MGSDDALTRADRRARLDALDISRSFIVQAPAGSGKTELLIQRYLRLLATVDDPEEILAITFTRKAAREMQQRVSFALSRAQNGVTAKFDHEQTTLDAAAAVLERDLKNDWQLIKSPRRMRIQTLDALCAGITRLVPLSSGSEAIGNTIVNAEAKAIYRSAAIATLDWLLVDNEMNAAVENVLGHLDNNTGIYVAYISRMLESRDQWLDITGTGRIDDPDAVRKLLERNIADVVRHQLRAVDRRIQLSDVNRMPSLAAYAGERLRKSGKTEHLAAALTDPDAMPGTDIVDLDGWRGLTDLLLTKSGRWRKTVTKNDGFPTGDDGQKKAWLQLVADLSGDSQLLTCLNDVRQLPDPHYDDSQWSVLLALLKLLPLAVSELKRIFAERGVTDHVEVAQAAGSALGNPDEPGEVALMLDYRIRHLLLDEMQDTSISQYRLLESLTAGWESGDGRTLFCVGDPMQSIYRFRNAEVGQFVLAREAGVNGLPLDALTLRQNFRSGEHLVNWFNTVFDQILPDEDDIATGAISYSASVPVGSLGGSGEVRVYPSFNTSPADEASATANIIKSCLSNSNDQDIAVLVRSRTQLTLLLEELRQANILYHAIEIDRLTDLPEIINLLALTRAFCHDADRTAWLGLLRSPMVGLTWTDLHLLVLDGSGETVWNLIHDKGRVKRLSKDAQTLLGRLRVTLQSCLGANRVQTLRERIERAWYRLGGPGLLQSREQLDNVYRFLDVLGEIETGGTLADPAALELRLDDERVSSHAGDECRLQVMTVHKSKGLEFDHVVLPGLGRSTSTSKKAVMSWLNIPDTESGRGMIISPVGPSSELANDPLHQYIQSRLDTSDRLELDRLLYVACTRARKSLHLVGHVNTSSDGSEMKDPHSGSLLRRLWPALKTEYAKAFDKHAGTPVPPGHADDEMYGAPILKRAAIGWTMPAPPLLPKSRSANIPLDEVTERTVEFYWVGAAARHAGTIVHRWLHKYSEEKSWPKPDDLNCTEALTRRWSAHLRVHDDDIAFVCNRVRLALTGILKDEKGCWILGGEGYSEFALTGFWKNRAESIVIDRVRIDDQGVHWIIDYKTSVHEGGNLEGFLRHEEERYRQQMQKYATIYKSFAGVPVKAALYFPLLQQFREVSLPQQ